MRGLIAVLVALSVWQGVVWPAACRPSSARTRAGGAGADGSRRDAGGECALYAGQSGGGLALGVALGVGTAVNLALSPAARWLLRPMLIAAQAVPVFALAPILTLWLG